MMTTQQINAEHSYYLWLCEKQYNDHFITCQSIESYSPTQRNQAAAETAYIMLKRRLPLWTTIIQRIEILADDTIIFIHHDPNHIH